MDRSGSFKRVLNHDDPERLFGSDGDLSRKRSLIRPERQRLSRDDPHYYYALASEASNVSVRPSTTGNDPLLAGSQTYHSGLSAEADRFSGDEQPILDRQGSLLRSSSLLSRTRQHSFRRSGSVKRTGSVSRSGSRSDHQDSRTSYGSQTNEPLSASSYIHDESEAAPVEADTAPVPETPQETIEDHSPHMPTNGEDIGEEERPAVDQTHSLAAYEPELPPQNGSPESNLDWDDDLDEKLPARRPIMPKENKFDLWATYCKVLTFPVVPAMMRPFGMTTPDRQMAWREKIGLISVILMCGAFVGYLTFGFTESVCKNKGVRIHVGNMPSDDLLISGSVYDFGSYEHPGVDGIEDNSPILYPPVNAGGKDASFMFQNVNGNCKGLIKPKSNTSIPHNDDGEMGWYFPCQLINLSNNTLVDNEDLVKNGTKLYDGWGCHTHNSARDDLYKRKRTALIYYTWEDLSHTNGSQLINFNGDILNLDYLDHLLRDDLDYPEIFDVLRHDTSLRGRDISQEMSYGQHRTAMKCLREITKVGEVDTEAIGCIASKVVLYVSLVFIMGLVVIKFLLACYFRFFVARAQGAFTISEREFAQRDRQIENWGDNIYSSANGYRDGIVPTSPAVGDELANSPGTLGTPNSRRFLPLSSSPHIGAQKPDSAAMSIADPNQNKRRSVFIEKLTNPHHESQRIKGVTMTTQNPEVSSSKVVSGQSLQRQPLYRQSVFSRPGTIYEQYGNSQLEDISYRGAEPEAISMDDLAPPSSMYTAASEIGRSESPYSVISDNASSAPVPSGPVGGVTEYNVPQPPVDFQPFGYPLAHVMCMVTAYSESVEGLRTTLDSVCTTEYPNSHKLIAIVCDGLIKGSGNDMTTPEICLSMMKDFSEPIEDAKAYSYVSVVSGKKRHNMAKVYAGFYNYDDSTVPPEQQQRVPILCVVKCGTPAEAGAAKPGNRGKRDSQIILMSFLQHVMFDERMTELEYEMFNGIRSVSGIAPDYYEMMLMVDADTKVFPDCLTHMCAEMVSDPEIMGLCGETKIANKRDTWVTMIQVFEYFISHHQAKAFESVFGGVTCLPGCFSMYRIKSPKGAEGYWVPILCNPDIVERYSDNNTSTLHRKNLLLLGEDRFLSTLMLRTFPKRKMMFVPKAACKTMVPDEFKVLLSQRRRWINSTIHNLFELVLVRDLCGVFIISMQFVVFVDLISTLVLPAAISFTLYVVVIACYKKPTPTLSLILLAMILGLPGVLIVVTATRASYVLWMLVYLGALPIWNFVLPMYAYWHFDDFSWGDTRAIVGGDKGHEEDQGEFDSSQIVMKRWREFQRDRAREAYTMSNQASSSVNDLGYASQQQM